jgi:hypothetical protein
MALPHHPFDGVIYIAWKKCPTLGMRGGERRANGTARLGRVLEAGKIRLHPLEGDTGVSATALELTEEFVKLAFKRGGRFRPQP